MSDLIKNYYATIDKEELADEIKKFRLTLLNENPIFEKTRGVPAGFPPMAEQHLLIAMTQLEQAERNVRLASYLLTLEI